MLNYSYRSIVGLTSLTLGLAVATFAPLLTLTPVAAQSQDSTSFPDIQDHWAQPFIRALADRKIVINLDHRTICSTDMGVHYVTIGRCGNHGAPGTN